MGRKRTASHPLVEARVKAEAAFLDARHEPVSTQLPLWEEWHALQEQCKEQKLKGCAKEFAKPGGPGEKPGGQGVSQEALMRMCTEVQQNTRNKNLGPWKDSRLLANLSPGRSWQENFIAGCKRQDELWLNKRAAKKARQQGEASSSSSGGAAAMASAAPAEGN